jgi:hypothetical protein
VEDENSEAVHPRFDGRNGFLGRRLTQVDAFDLSKKSGSPPRTGFSRVAEYNPSAAIFRNCRGLGCSQDLEYGESDYYFSLAHLIG